MDGDRHYLCRSGSTVFSMSIIGHLEGHTEYSACHHQDEEH